MPVRGPSVMIAMSSPSPRPSVIKLLAEEASPLFRVKGSLIPMENSPTAGLCLLHGRVLHVPADARHLPRVRGASPGPQSCFGAPGSAHSTWGLLRRRFDVAPVPLKVCSHPVYPRICWAHAYPCSPSLPPPPPSALEPPRSS